MQWRDPTPHRHWDRSGQLPAPRSCPAAVLSSSGRRRGTLGGQGQVSAVFLPCWGWPEGLLIWQGKGGSCSLPGPCPKASCLVHEAVGHPDWRCPAQLPLSNILLSTALTCQLPAKLLTMHVVDDHLHHHLQQSCTALSRRQGSPTKCAPVSHVGGKALQTAASCPASHAQQQRSQSRPCLQPSRTTPPQSRAAPQNVGLSQMRRLMSCTGTQ